MKYFIFILVYVVITLVLFAILASIGINYPIINFIIASVVCLTLKPIAGE